MSVPGCDLPGGVGGNAQQPTTPIDDVAGFTVPGAPTTPSGPSQPARPVQPEWPGRPGSGGGFFSS